LTDKLFKYNKPELVALTIQDSTLNGPFASAALKNNIPLYIFPHSHVINWRTLTKSVVVTEWWQPKESESIFGEKNTTIYLEHKKNTKIKEQNEVNKTEWMVIYNGIQENIANTVKFSFVREVIDYIERKIINTDLKIIHRLKPGDQTPVNTYAEMLGKNVEELNEIVKQNLEFLLTKTKLVISVDEPSSALWEALINGCAVILVTDRELPYESLCDNQIIKAINMEDFKKLINRIISDEKEFDDYHSMQQNKLNELKRKRLN
jgi:hypothetical protein